MQFSTLKELGHAIESHLADNKDLESAAHLADAYVGEDWKEYVTWSDEKYTRNHIMQTELFEMLVICWDVEQGSPFHDHPERGCLLRVMQGTLQESRYRDGEVYQVEQYHPPSVSYMHNRVGVHQMKNISDARAISLHIYAPGYYTPNIVETSQD